MERTGTRFPVRRFEDLGQTVLQPLLVGGVGILASCRSRSVDFAAGTERSHHSAQESSESFVGSGVRMRSA